MNPSFPELVEITPDALSACSRYAAARGVAPEAMISGCVVAHLLRQPVDREEGGFTRIGRVVVRRTGVALFIQTDKEFDSTFFSLVARVLELRKDINYADQTD